MNSIKRLKSLLVVARLRDGLWMSFFTFSTSPLLIQLFSSNCFAWQTIWPKCILQGFGAWHAVLSNRVSKREREFENGRSVACFTNNLSPILIMSISTDNFMKHSYILLIESQRLYSYSFTIHWFALGNIWSILFKHSASNVLVCDVLSVASDCCHLCHRSLDRKSRGSCSACSKFCSNLHHLTVWKECFDKFWI